MKKLYELYHLILFLEGNYTTVSILASDANVNAILVIHLIQTLKLHYPQF